jgi:hypothetical protein
MYLELQLKYIKQFNVCRISKALLPYKKMQHQLLAPLKILQKYCSGRLFSETTANVAAQKTYITPQEVIRIPRNSNERGR